jgi:hypothetical protein
MQFITTHFFTIVVIFSFLSSLFNKGSGVSTADFGASAIAAIIAAVISAAATGTAAAVDSANTASAKDEAMRLSAKNDTERKANDRFEKDILMGNARNQRNQVELQKDRFSQEKNITGYNMIKDKIGQVESLLNTNIGLQNNVLKKWSGV